MAEKKQKMISFFKCLEYSIKREKLFLPEILQSSLFRKANIYFLFILKHLKIFFFIDIERFFSDDVFSIEYSAPKTALNFDLVNTVEFKNLISGGRKVNLEPFDREYVSSLSFQHI